MGDQNSSLKKLMMELGMNDKGNLPEKWDTSLISHEHYLNVINEKIASADYVNISVGVHVFIALPDKPTRTPQVGGGLAGGGADEEPIADFNSRLAEYRFDYTNAVESNKTYSKGATFIIDTVKSVIGESTMDELRQHIFNRDVLNLLQAFVALGASQNPQLAFSAKHDLGLADFRGVSIQIVKAVIDQVRIVVDKNNGAGNRMPDIELRVILFEKALQSDTSPKKDKYTHCILNMEQDNVTVFSYQQAFTKLKAVSIQYDARNFNGNLVNHVLARYGELKGDTEVPNANLSKTEDNPKCIACGKGHNIQMCNNNYPCSIDKLKTHNIKEICQHSGCVQPKDKLKKYLEYVKLMKEEREKKGNTKSNKNSNKASAKVASEPSDSEEASKSSKKQKRDQASRAIENSNHIEIAELLNSMKATLDTFVANHTKLAKDVDRMGSVFNQYVSENNTSRNSARNVFGSSQIDGNTNTLGLIRGNDNSARRIGGLTYNLGSGYTTSRNRESTFDDDTDYNYHH